MAETATSTSSSGFNFNSLLRGDLIFAIGIVAILLFMLVPIPSWLLDMGLSISVAFSVLILMIVLFIRTPLEFSTFPTVLLIATALRLGLNVASTRLILSEGHTGTAAAGQVIEAFGGIIIQGSYVGGGIVFAILVIVNFVVITKGSGRIAEVAARFTLDAMPGKQMAIDADMSAGLITEEEAKERRKNLEQESTFFGAMDGAAKFVRGDAIAGLLITFINIVGGIIIGTMFEGLSLSQAAASYTVLTIGDGLVSQIPALIVSVSAGLLVSKAGVEGAANVALLEQFSRYPKALGMSSGLMLALGLTPGIPFLPFAILAGITGGLAYLSWQQDVKEQTEQAELAQLTGPGAPVAEEPISKALAMDIIRLELGYGLLPLVQGDGTKLTDQVKGLRRQLAEDMGYILPSVRIQDNLQLPANTYTVRIKEIESGRGEVRPGMLMCMDPSGSAITLPGESTIEPTFGLPAMWIDEQYREEAHFKGYTVVDAATVVTTHLTEIVKDNMPDLLSYAETQKLLDELPQEYQKLVADVIPAQISIGGLQRILQHLVSERVSVRDLPAILEGIAEAASYTKNTASLTEHVRTRLSRQLCDSNSNANGQVPLLTLSPEWEQAFGDALVGNGEERQLAMAPSQLQNFITMIREKYDEMAQQGQTPVLLCSPLIRPYVRSVVERFRPQTVVMSQNEIHPKAKIKTLGSV
ncbi:MAG: flagellar biosynthesis protein FlhA [Rhodospirillales bacterium]|nr:flagellar biosynthesis protein FlhA [Rhodospirillales bacterium]MCB9965181.1 flagellar biosynthesis protein FlhA [Rhodospirillales bacterium]MCB9973200.1 flagellar biosynthesis protein FlhA [Rhodospirillales bacterium]MCB9979540.1 flagellar biosynthesis protein FlhA [Rhodospirillales bacterium]